MFPTSFHARSLLSSSPAVWTSLCRSAFAVLSLGLAACLTAAESVPAPPPAPPTKPATVDFAKDVAPIIKKFCYECHTGDEPEGEFSLHFVKEQDFLDRASSERAFFEKMVENLQDRKMPPEDAPQPADADRHRLIEWVERKILARDPKAGRNPSQVSRIGRPNNADGADIVRELSSPPTSKVAASRPAPRPIALSDNTGK